MGFGKKLPEGKVSPNRALCQQRGATFQVPRLSDRYFLPGTSKRVCVKRLLVWSRTGCHRSTTSPCYSSEQWWTDKLSHNHRIGNSSISFREEWKTHDLSSIAFHWPLPWGDLPLSFSNLGIQVDLKILMIPRWQTSLKVFTLFYPIA